MHYSAERTEKGASNLTLFHDFGSLGAWEQVSERVQRVERIEKGTERCERTSERTKERMAWNVRLIQTDLRCLVRYFGEYSRNNESGDNG